MPVDLKVDFLAVDEVQLAADRERGHVFTDRVLHARGALETWLIGAETIRPLLHKLLPEAAFQTRAAALDAVLRASRSGCRSCRARSAVIVFSLRELYEVAARLRRERGGAALVFGALSPRTRNAQVGLYQGGEVDHLVATDAIGMGLNLDIDTVVFTGLAKFDGVGPRRADPRRGRPDRRPRRPPRARRPVRGHDGARPARPATRRGGRVAPLRAARPSSSGARTSSTSSRRSRCSASLDRQPPHPFLVRMRHAEDQRALAVLVRDAEVMALAPGPRVGAPAVGGVPGARLPERAHRGPHAPARARLPLPARSRRAASREDFLPRTSRSSTGPRARWTRCSAASRRSAPGPTCRIASRWVAGPALLAGADARGRGPALRRASRAADAGVRRPAGHGDRALRAVGARDERSAPTARSLVQGLRAGVLEGFRFRPDRGGERGLARAARRGEPRAARRSCASGCRRSRRSRTRRSRSAPGAEVALARRARSRGSRPATAALAPQVDVLRDATSLDPPLRERVRRRLAAWLDGHLRAGAGAALRAARARAVGRRARARVRCSPRGSAPSPRRAVAQQVARPHARGAARARRGSASRSAASRCSCPRCRSPRRCACGPGSSRCGSGLPAEAGPDGAPSVPNDLARPLAFYLACGYLPARARAPCGSTALERAAAVASRLSHAGPFVPPRELPGDPRLRRRRAAGRALGDGLRRAGRPLRTARAARAAPARVAARACPRAAAC